MNLKKVLFPLLIMSLGTAACDSNVLSPDCSEGQCPVEESDIQSHTMDIINGSKAAAGELRSTVMLYYNYSGTKTAFCTGTLITPEWVLTAGHCVKECEDDDTIKYYLPYAHIGIGNSEGQIEYSCDYDRLIAHPNFKCSDSLILHDIALVHLKRAVP